MNKLKDLYKGLVEFVDKNKTVIVYILITVSLAYLFSSKKKIHFKNDIEVNVEFDSIGVDGVDVDTIIDTLKQ